jgi:hypothetical protein
MDESFSPTIFLYGVALVLAVGKAFTLTIWRILPKPRPGLRQEMLQVWKNRRLRKQAATSPIQHRRSAQTVDDPLRDEGVKAEPHATVSTPEKGFSNTPRVQPSS